MLESEAFGVITEIDIQKPLNAKIGVDPISSWAPATRPWPTRRSRSRIGVGTMRPCTVVVQAPPDGTVEIAEINPVASLQAINKSALAAKATEVAAKLRSALDRI